jgi:hypothetical protein
MMIFHALVCQVGHSAIAHSVPQLRAFTIAQEMVTAGLISAGVVMDGTEMTAAR